MIRLLLIVVFIFPIESAFAYVGPGTGLTAIGTILALLVAFVVAIVGFVWYPVKRMMRKRKQQQAQGTDADKDKEGEAHNQ